MEFNVDCDADIILGYDWLRAQELNFFCDTNAVCLCAERGCMSGRRVHLDLTLDAPASPATRLSPIEARAILGTVGLGEVATAAWAEATLGRGQGGIGGGAQARGAGRGARGPGIEERERGRRQRGG